MLGCVVDGGVARVTLDRPEVLNALSEELLSRLAARMAVLAGDDGVRAIVIGGAGRAFSAGADVADFERLDSAAARRRYIEHSLHCLDVVAGSPKPTIAFVDGLALGGGCELALACDIVVASERASFGLPEARLGVLPTYALTHGRSRLSPGTLAYLSFSARRIDAAEALRLGVADLLGDAGELAREIAANAPLAVRLAKRLLRDGGGLAAAADASVAALSSPDHAERVARFRSARS
ncbi:MAG TPA: enoyl-CoA hydratase/isomerase family protein [Solirubrobacter sp.]|nr:enoyl-CoA hydratase/isomerase family protein [Solirubrobacter sp.]